MYNEHLTETLVATEHRLRAAHGTHLGYPYNLVGRSSVPEIFNHYLINNLGDPYAGSHFASEVCALERQVISWMKDLWQCPDDEEYWGSVGASGTEGNLWALYLAREALPSAVLIHSDDAHYSIPKSARILRIESISVSSHASGAVSIASLAEALAGIGSRPVIVALTCGTTMHGAHDDIAGTIDCLERHGFDRSRRFIHLDGALNAMILPFVSDAPHEIRPTFRHDIDSISTSGHKMIGTPMPCGILIARRRHVQRIASAITYLRSNDTTLMGSRNGHAVLALWTRLRSHGLAGYAHDVTTCLERARKLATSLSAAGVPVLQNSYSLTVVFPQPCEAIVGKYQLASNRGKAHAIVMPNVTDELIEQFTSDYLAWWSEQKQPLKISCGASPVTVALGQVGRNASGIDELLTSPVSHSAVAAIEEQTHEQ